MRGLIKIQGNQYGEAGGPLDWATATNEWLSEVAPFIINISNWVQGQQPDYQQREETADWQRSAGYLHGEYLMYADNLEVIFHAEKTQGFRGPGGDTQTATNKSPYREIKWSTTISPRDPDLPTPIGEGLHQGHGIGDLIMDALTEASDRIMGVAEIKAYYEKRAKYLRDLDGIPVKVSSTMFQVIDGYITADKYTMQQGAVEAIYDIGVTESVDTTAAEVSKTEKAVPIEPGVGFK